MHRIAIPAFLLIVAACGGPTQLSGDDAGPASDAGPDMRDDAGSGDTGPGDAGSHRPIDVPDAGSDSNVSRPDSGGDDAGSPDTGPMAIDSGTDSGSPDAGGDTTPVVQLALGESHTCALRSSGRVMCWGNPSFAGWPAPALLDATEIAAVVNDTYARRRDGTVVRWRGTGGALTVVADMPPDPVMPPAMYAPGESFPLPTGDYVEIYGSARDACGRRMNGSIWCWGSNNYGQLARETGELTETGYAYPPGEALMGGARMNATTIGVGAFHRCAVLADGRVVCWGSNSLGQLGRWVTGLESVEPVEPEWY